MSHAAAVRPLEIVAMDFTQLEKSTSGIENVLVFTDVFTKYTITISTREVKKSKMTQYHPRGNSQVERFNRSMKEEKMDWPLTGIGICLQLYTPFHYILYSILSIFWGMMPGYQWIIYFIPQVIEA